MPMFKYDPSVFQKEADAMAKYQEARRQNILSKRKPPQDALPTNSGRGVFGAPFELPKGSKLPLPKPQAQGMWLTEEYRKNMNTIAKSYGSMAKQNDNEKNAGAASYEQYSKEHKPLLDALAEERKGTETTNRQLRNISDQLGYDDTTPADENTLFKQLGKKISETIIALNDHLPYLNDIQVASEAQVTAIQSVLAQLGQMSTNAQDVDTRDQIILALNDLASNLIPQQGFPPQQNFVYSASTGMVTAPASLQGTPKAPVSGFSPASTPGYTPGPNFATSYTPGPGFSFTPQTPATSFTPQTPYHPQTPATLPIPGLNFPTPEQIAAQAPPIDFSHTPGRILDQPPQRIPVLFPTSSSHVPNLPLSNFPQQGPSTPPRAQSPPQYIVVPSPKSKGKQPEDPSGLSNYLANMSIIGSPNRPHLDPRQKIPLPQSTNSLEDIKTTKVQNEYTFVGLKTRLPDHFGEPAEFTDSKGKRFTVPMTIGLYDLLLPFKSKHHYTATVKDKIYFSQLLDQAELKVEDRKKMENGKKYKINYMSPQARSYYEASSSRQGNGLRSIRPAKSGKISGEIVYYHSVYELKKRLKILLGEIQAGNNSKVFKIEIEGTQLGKEIKTWNESQLFKGLKVWIWAQVSRIKSGKKKQSLIDFRILFHEVLIMTGTSSKVGILPEDS